VRVTVCNSHSKLPGKLASQALVELALVLPVSIIILLGMIDLGRGFVYGVAIEQGAREAARVASTASLDVNVTDSVVLQRLILASAPAISDCATTLSGVQACGGGTWTFSLNLIPAGGSPTYTSLAAARAGQPRLSGAQVEVRASGSVSMFAGFVAGGLGLSAIRVQGDAVMPII
jgi:hypothetical protein